ncbi:MAG: NYN domain-containing protein, partial [Clostridia bacterium]|nr:NYN domain-containing protein [Clostridia bacterium]
RRSIPTFVFFNKTDLPGKSPDELMTEVQKLIPGAVRFPDGGMTAETAESVALLDEALLENVVAGGEVSDGDVARLVREGKLTPCFFGSALRDVGVDRLLDALDRYTVAAAPSPLFGAVVYKITHDEKGARQTHLKLTGGSLAVRDAVTYTPLGADAPVTEKISQIRLFSGEKKAAVEHLEIGGVAAVTGLSGTFAGQGLGTEPDDSAAVLEPVLSYRVILPAGTDERQMLPKMRELEEEDPTLHVAFDERLGEITVRLMGEVQTETLTHLVEDRFGVKISFGEPRILYRETAASVAEGVGHFEPLRHYAEVHLLLEPQPIGTGLIFDTACPEEQLGLSWQRLVLTHLSERRHRGILTGAPLTDLKITLLTGRAHQKHTEGGDFREATYRAVRQGLMRAGGALLEPVYAFRLTVPTEQIGRAITDVRQMSGTFAPPETEGDFSILTGHAPVSEMRNYMREVTAYTRGRGSLSLLPDGYAPCHNTDEVVAAAGYDPEADLRHTPDSVFCAHGAGFPVKWNEVEKYMDLEPALKRRGEAPKPRPAKEKPAVDPREIEAIMLREFGPIRRRSYGERTVYDAKPPKYKPSRREKYLLVDGYNVIFAWDTLRELAAVDLPRAREVLTELLVNYAAYTGVHPVVVFDGYRVKGSIGEKTEQSGVRVVYTKEGETADAYVEKLLREIGRDYDVRVVTSDGLIQVTAVTAGVLRMSAREFEDEMRRVSGEITAFIEGLSEKPLPEFVWPDTPEKKE